jgi:flagellar motor switch protein FliM
MIEALAKDEIDRLCTLIDTTDTRAADTSAAETGAVPQEAACKKTVTPHDFRRHGRLSREHIGIVRSVHEAFALDAEAKLSAKLRSAFRVRLADVSQLPYGGFARSVPAHPVLVFVGTEAPAAVIEITPALAFAVIDRLLGGTGIGADVPQRALTDIERVIIEGFAAPLLECLETAWGQSARLLGIETDPARLAAIAPKDEAAVLIPLETAFAGIEGTLRLCVPCSALGPVIRKLTARGGRNADSRERLEDGIANTGIGVSAFLGTIRVPVRDVLSLRAGDVLRLNSVRTGDHLPVSVGGELKFLCRPGVSGGKMAVQITKTIAAGAVAPIAENSVAEALL